MTTATLHPMAQRLAWLAELDVAQADREGCLRALGDYGTVLRFLQGLESRLAARLAEVSPTPEHDTAQSARTSRREAAQSQRRGQGRRQSGPAGEGLGLGMDQGDISGAHLDAYLRVRETLAPELRDEFSSHRDDIVTWAVRCPLDLFTRRLKVLADAIRERRGIRLLDEQKRQTFLKTWVDRHTGLLRLTGAFDPQSGLALSGRLEAMLATLFAEATPPTCPDDPVAKQDHLRALALLALTEHGPTCAGSRGTTEVMVVVDTTQRDERGRPVVDWGLPVDLPLDVLAEHLTAAHRLTVVDLHRNGDVTDRTAQLQQGRRTRLANRVQRRVLRARYATCVVPTCDVPFDRCDIHHVSWWRHGGTTDVENLAPLCSQHHDAVHRRGWRLRVGDDGHITVILPNGQQLTPEGDPHVAHAPPHTQSEAGTPAYASSVPVQEDMRDAIE